MSDIKTVPALALADALPTIVFGELAQGILNAAAAELRRQHALIAQMQRDAVQPPEGWKLVMVPDLQPEDEPDWDECIRQAELATGLCVERHTLSIVIREVRRWLAGRQAQALDSARHSQCRWPDCSCYAPQGPGLCRYSPAQALDSQLQQPDGHSVAGDLDASYGACAQHGLAHPCEVCAAESVTAQMEAALAECRDLFPIPEPGEPAETEWLEAMSYPPSVPAFIRASLAATTRRSAAGAQQQDDHASSPAPSARAIHYPECWDTAAYPTLESALAEVYAAFRCTNEDTHPAPSAQSSKAALSDDEREALEKIESLLTNMQPHIEQACKPGHAQFIDNYVGPALEIARAGIGESRREPLTADEVHKLCGVEDRDAMMKSMALYCARTIEAAHGITKEPQA